MKGFPDLPPLWLALALVLNWALARMVPGFSVGAFATSVSWTLIGAGLFVIGWAAVWFWRRKTTIEPHHDAQVLIVEGPFRFSRNPIYLALLVILLGAVIGRGQPLGLGLVAGLWWVLDRRFAVPEEQGLRAQFGTEAERYLAATRRWL
ncbi:MAG: isoprenylcysteine carboxylmethyltransferase family protein [Pseudomonadota bacterium]